MLCILTSISDGGWRAQVPFTATRIIVNAAIFAIAVVEAVHKDVLEFGCRSQT